MSFADFLRFHWDEAEGDDAVLVADLVDNGAPAPRADRNANNVAAAGDNNVNGAGAHVENIGENALPAGVADAGVRGDGDGAAAGAAGGGGGAGVAAAGNAGDDGIAAAWANAAANAAAEGEDMPVMDHDEIEQLELNIAVDELLGVR